jgi:hypothetical protein
MLFWLRVHQPIAARKYFHVIAMFILVHIMYHVTCRAEQILEDSGVSIAPPPRVSQSVATLVPSQAGQVMSTRLRQDQIEESSEESGMSLLLFVEGQLII